MLLIVLSNSQTYQISYNEKLISYFHLEINHFGMFTQLQIYHLFPLSSYSIFQNRLIFHETSLTIVEYRTHQEKPLSSILNDLGHFNCPFGIFFPRYSLWVLPLAISFYIKTKYQVCLCFSRVSVNRDI